MTVAWVERTILSNDVESDRTDIESNGLKSSTTAALVTVDSTGWNSTAMVEY